MTTDKLRNDKSYGELTILQASQVYREYCKTTDPWQYEYEIDPRTGKVTDRFMIPARRPSNGKREG